MKALISAYQARFQSLTDREQKLVLVSAVVVVIGLFYWLVWSPLTSGIAQQQRLLDNQQQLLVWVEDSAARAKQLRAVSAGSASFRGSLPQAVNTTTNRHNIVISRMQPQGDEMQVWIDQAPFDDLVAWLHALEQMGVVIQQADITESGVPGYIKVRRLELGKS